MKYRLSFFLYITISLFYIEKIIRILRFFLNIKRNKYLVKSKGKPYYWGLNYSPVVKPNKRLIVLANGPSLQEDISRLNKQGGTEDCDLLMMNFSASQDIFTEYKPKYYALADPMFFHEDYRIEKVRKVFKDIDEKVSWEMTLLLAEDVIDFLKFSGLRNPLLKFQRIQKGECPFDGNKKYEYYKKGLSMPPVGTVANMAVFAGIQYGYKQIELCGNDMSLLEGLCVNDKNETCTIYRYYYDKDAIMKPCIDPFTGKPFRLDSYIDMVNKMIKSHRQLADYGNYMNVTIINRTRKSMMDCYTRLIVVHPELFN